VLGSETQAILARDKFDRKVKKYEEKNPLLIENWIDSSQELCKYCDFLK